MIFGIYSLVTAPFPSNNNRQNVAGSYSKQQLPGPNEP